MKKTLLYSLIVAAGLTTTSCNDYLDLEPITSVSTTDYLYAENDLAAYAANLYGNLPSHGTGYSGLGLFDDDNGTDNQTAASPSTLFVTGQTYVEVITTFGIRICRQFELQTISWKQFLSVMRMEK